MTLAFATATRNAWLDAITTAVGANGQIHIYNAPRPASGGAATTQLALLTCGATFAPAASGGVLTVSAITGDTAADATGTATWFRVTTSGGTFVIDGDVSTSGSDLNLNTTNIVINGPVAISSFVITAPNP